MIKWNEYTWYSKWASLIFFILILPILTFYIGTQYQEAKYVSKVAVSQNILDKSVKQSPLVSSTSTNLYRDDLIEFQYPSGYSVKDSWPGSDYEQLEISNGIVTFFISDVPAGFGDDWSSYAPSENFAGYKIRYLQSGQSFRMVASKESVPYSITAVISNGEDASNSEIKAVFQNILRSLKEI
ncbi:MAG: hypothetical protein V4664_03515 [Patescibacteria group bacterium]